MNISSFNVTDVGYHYIGLRVIAAMPTTTREEQSTTISRSVLKYARDRALRLMLPEPRGSYETVGDKVCQELAHFGFAEGAKGRGYQLTSEGTQILELLKSKSYRELRRKMALVHLQTYANLRAVVHAHIANREILSPAVEAGRQMDAAYIATLLRPSFGSAAEEKASAFCQSIKDRTPKQIEDALRDLVLGKLIPQHSIGLPLFRSMTDRLVSLRLLNSTKASRDEVEFLRTYSPCVEDKPIRKWHQPATVSLDGGRMYTICLSEPDFHDEEMQQLLLAALEEAFRELPAQAGYFDLPDARDLVCDKLSIPEATFDDGVIALLEKPAPPITLGLTYERITGRRKPLVRTGESVQIYNLIRRA